MKYFLSEAFFCALITLAVLALIILSFSSWLLERDAAQLSQRAARVVEVQP